MFEKVSGDECHEIRGRGVTQHGVRGIVTARAGESSYRHQEVGEVVRKQNVVEAQLELSVRR
jgi:hypothetical protein